MSQTTSNPADPRINLAYDRTKWASFRTRLALDRTTLAWVRTTLAIAGFGFGMVGFFRTLEEKAPSAASIRMHEGAIRFGTTLIIIGIVATILVSVSHWFTLRRLLRGETPGLTQWPLSITLALLLSILGLTGLWTLYF